MTGMEDGHVAIRIEDPLVMSMKQKLPSFGSEAEEQDYCTIYRVLPATRHENPRAYDPKIISIGPFHRGKQALRPMDDLKWRYLHDLLRRSPSNTLDKYVDAARASEIRARKHYSERVKPLNRDAFVEMMVLDGCFILEFLIKMILCDKRGQLYAVNWNLPLLRNDLLLLENQIPFFLLQSLFDSSEIPELAALVENGDTPITLTELAHSYVTSGKTDNTPIPNTVHHLLHLFQSSLHPNPEPFRVNSGVWPGMRVISKINNLISHSFFWILSAFLYCRRPPPAEEISRAPRAIPSIVELEEAGVQFKKKKVECFLDVTFRNGTMEIPVLPIQEATISQFRNLVAFEQCCPATGSHFTAYAALMGHLISTPADVALLEGLGILESKLSSDEEVAKFFNSLCKGGYLDYENHYLVKLYKGVREYCEVGRHRWRARLVHDYFGNPWTIISVIVASILLVLTFLQTFYAVYAYAHPPH